MTTPPESSNPTPPRQAVCLRYARDEDPVPRVVAKGRGLVAERILELAREHGLPVREDPELVELLAACELGDDIAPDLFAAVAELLAFLYRVQRSDPTSAPGAR